MKIVFQNALFRYRYGAFTLIEILVSIAVLSLLIALVSQLVSSTTMVTASFNKRMDADRQATILLERISTDVIRMVKRADVDYYLKIKQGDAVPQPGNDQIAFFCEVPGYSSVSPSSISLVGYRVNSNFQLERLGKGLLWNGSPESDPPMVFLPKTISSTWPAATNSITADSDYETIGPLVFRFEYYYYLKNGTYSATPWSASASSSTEINGLRDVDAIAVTIAVIDPKSRVLVTNSQLSTLVNQMEDFVDGMKPGELEAQWQSQINASTIPHLAASSIRIYSRVLYLATGPQ